MGMVTVLVGASSPPAEPSQDGADICIADILDLADAICPWLMS
jgi:hypothetical protein